MPLHLDYRPTTIDDFAGNRSLVDSLGTILSRGKDIPHAFMFTGASGCGKTTLGRIVKNALNCADSDYKELDSAAFRGIDTVREIRNQARLRPMAGPVRVWLIDECFSSDTLIKTVNGEKTISDIKIGDSIYSLNGIDKVVDVFKNKVSIDRIVKLTLSNKKTVYTTKQHLFYTVNGWKEAQSLKKNDYFFSFNCNIMEEINLQKELKNVNVRMVRGRLSEESRKTKMLHKILCSKIKKLANGLWSFGRKKMQILSKTIYSEKVFNSYFLFPILCWEMESFKRGNERRNILTRIKKKNIKSNENKNEQKRSEGKTFFINEKQEPHVYERYCRKSETNKKGEWDLEYLEGRERGEWETDYSANNSFFGSWLANRICSFFRRKISRLPHLLQNRCSESRIKNRDRNRWQEPFIEQEYTKRCQKNRKVERVWVENIEVYKRGYNEQSFKSIIGHQEILQKFVEFFDLQIESHPSYFANGCPVHNCHKLTNDAQNALLKILEDTPKHVYFILCTTDPQKVLKTIQSRCMQFQVTPLSEKQMTRLLSDIVGKEGVTDFPEEAYAHIHQNSLGHVRAALVMLDKVIDLEPNRILKAIEQSKGEEGQVIDLCRALLKKEPWKKVCPILRAIQEEQEAESVRYAVLGYMNSVLLKEDNQHAAICIEQFKNNFYDSGKAGLTEACYSIISL